MTPPMDNWKSPNQEKEPVTTEMPLEERLRALEQQVAKHQSAPDTGAPGKESGQHAWHPGVDMPEAPAVARLATFSSDRDAQRDQLHNAGMSLVDRIADVDDERRRATARLQKAWQTHRDELDDQLRRHTWSTVTLLVLFTALIGAALFFAYRQIGAEQQQLTSQLAGIKTNLDRLSTSAPPPDQQSSEAAGLAARLDELSITVAELSEAWQKIQSAPAADQQQAADARIAAEIKQLEDRQQLASQELESLRQVLGAVQPSDDALSQPEQASAGDTETEGADTTDTATPVERRTLVVGDRPFALQLIGVRSRESLMEFAERDDLPPEVYFREETYKGRPWFVLMHSLHETAEDAGDELARLPQGLAALGPWIRNLSVGSQLQVLAMTQSDQSDQ